MSKFLHMMFVIRGSLKKQAEDHYSDHHPSKFRESCKYIENHHATSTITICKRIPLPYFLDKHKSKRSKMTEQRMKPEISVLQYHPVYSNLPLIGV
jgi:hypothetical protein